MKILFLVIVTLVEILGIKQFIVKSIQEAIMQEVGMIMDFQEMTID